MWQKSSVRVFRWFGGLFLDIKRKVPHYLSDYSDACSLQCVASFLFLYCACMSPVITFGGLLGEATEGRIVSPSCPVGFCIQKQGNNFKGKAASLLVPSECHWVAVWSLSDWNSVFPVCRAASHHPGQHWTRARVWEDTVQILQVRYGISHIICDRSPQVHLIYTLMMSLISLICDANEPSLAHLACRSFLALSLTFTFI